MGAVLQIYAELEDMGECYKCGVRFGAPPNFVRARRADKASFYCPNGHPQAFITSETERLRAELEAAKLHTKNAIDARDRAANAQRHAETELGKTKTRYQNLRKRVQNGVCPCCQRSFVQLARHMATKHPEYAAEST